MKAITARSVLLIIIALFSMGSMVGCTRVLGISKNDYRTGPGAPYYPTGLVEADRALHDARMAGKDKECPEEYNALKKRIDDAYAVHFACRTDEALAMARKAIGEINALCPPRPVVLKPAPAPAPAPPAPTSELAVAPETITRGESATLRWTSQNTTSCDLQPDVGAVEPQGSMKITPSADTAYTLTCTGAGGRTTSTGNIRVIAPPPAPKQEKVCIVLKVEFDTGKADIKSKYHNEIGRVAEFMKKYPEARGTIDGHTDNVGGYGYNMRLSERRAASVRNYLIEKYGIAPARLSSKGYGYTKPVASNKTKEGRQKNRRIEANFDCVVITK